MPTRGFPTCGIQPLYANGWWNAAIMKCQCNFNEGRKTTGRFAVSKIGFDLTAVRMALAAK